MKQIIMITVLVALGVCMCGCQKQITRETHEKITIEEIISEEIVIE